MGQDHTVANLQVVMADPTDACSEVRNAGALAGKVALFLGGSCSLEDKRVNILRTQAVAGGDGGCPAGSMRCVHGGRVPNLASTRRLQKRAGNNPSHPSPFSSDQA